MEYSGSWGKLVQEKNLKSKISQHCPFNHWKEFLFLFLCLQILQRCDCHSLNYLPVSAKDEGAKEQGDNKETPAHTGSNVNPFLLQGASILTPFLAVKQIAWKHIIKYQPMTSKKAPIFLCFMFSTYRSISPRRHV